MYRLWASGSLIPTFIVVMVALSMWFYHKQWVTKHRLHYALQNVELVSIGYYGTAQDGTQILGPGITVLSDTTNQKMLLLLKKSAGFHTKPSTLPADYMFGLESSQERGNSITVGYIISTGELGHDDDWCYVPPGFKAWMTTLPKPYHPKYKITRTPFYDAVQ